MKCKGEVLPEPVRPAHKPIPISAAERIAKDYGYDQVVVLGRRTGDDGGDHLTTYGINKMHCGIAAAIGRKFKQWMGWIDEGRDA